MCNQTQITLIIRNRISIGLKQETQEDLYSMVVRLVEAGPCLTEFQYYRIDQHHVTRIGHGLCSVVQTVLQFTAHYFNVLRTVLQQQQCKTDVANIIIW